MRSRIAGVVLGLTVVAGPAVCVAQVSDEVVKIGVVDDMSSIYAESGGAGSVVAARMAVKDFGDKVLGKSVELISADHQNKSDVGSSVVRKWFDVDKVDMIVGLGNSAVAIAAQKIAQDNKKVSIVAGAGSSDLTSKFCSPTGFHWVYDTYALAKVVARASAKSGGKTWYFITADYAFGHALERDTSRFVTAEGGQVIGSARSPIGTADFASFILQAQASKATNVAFAVAGGDFINIVKQAAEFQVAKAGQNPVGLLVYITDINGLSLERAQGLLLASAFYWDLDDDTRAFAQRFFAEHKAMPTMVQAGVYSATLHYLKAVQAANTDSGPEVAAKMKEMPIKDFMTKGGIARADGRVIRDMHLFQVKAPSDSKKPWDYYRKLDTIPGEQAFRPIGEGECSFAKQ